MKLDDSDPQTNQTWGWMGIACAALAWLLVILSGSLGIALLADFFVFSS